MMESDTVRRSIPSRNYKEDPLTQIVRMHQHNINSVMLQTARRLKRELHRGTRQVKDRTTDDKRKLAREEDVWTIPM